MRRSNLTAYFFVFAGRDGFFPDVGQPVEKQILFAPRPTDEDQSMGTPSLDAELS